MQKDIVHFKVPTYVAITDLRLLLIDDNSLAERRQTFALGDFVEFYGASIGRIDGFLIVKLAPDTNPHLFIKLTVAQEKDHRDPILNVRMFKLSSETILVGVPGIGLRRVYMLPVDVADDDGRHLQLRQKDGEEDKSQSGSDFLMVYWNVQYL